MSCSLYVELLPELEDCMVPKMMLQPIVENAIIHGLEGADSGSILVEVSRLSGNLLQITVTDSGHGLPPEIVGRYGDRSKDSHRGHLGLYNVDTILHKHYGTDFGLFLSNRKDGPGAIVSAVLPIQKEGDASC